MKFYKQPLIFFVVLAVPLLTFFAKDTSASTIGVSIRGNYLGLVGWWTFDGKNMTQNAVDSSGSGNTGYLTGFTSTTTVPGKVGQGLQFDGSNDYVSVGSASSLDGIAQLTYSAWVYSTSTPGSFPSGVYSVFGKRYKGFYLSNSASPAAVSLYIGGTVNLTLYCATSIALNKWYHIVVTWDGTLNNAPGTIFYINGISCSAAGAAGSGSIVDDSAQIGVIGFLGGGLTGYFKGMIDDVRVYNRVLSATEILQLYNIGR